MKFLFAICFLLILSITVAKGQQGLVGAWKLETVVDSTGKECSGIKKYNLDFHSDSRYAMYFVEPSWVIGKWMVDGNKIKFDAQSIGDPCMEWRTDKSFKSFEVTEDSILIIDMFICGTVEGKSYFKKISSTPKEIISISSKTHHQNMTDNQTAKPSKQDDTLKYEKIEKGFYRGPNGRLFIKTQSLISPPEEYGPDFYRPVPDIHLPTYELLCSQGWYAKDKDSVYIVNGTTDGKSIRVLENADASTFECINYRWGKDQNYVFQNGVILKGMNPQTMVIVDEDANGFFSFVKDEDQVFMGLKEIKNVDVNSFELIKTDSTTIYQDKDWVYDEEYFYNGDEEYRRKK